MPDTRERWQDTAEEKDILESVVWGFAYPRVTYQGFTYWWADTLKSMPLAAPLMWPPVLIGSGIPERHARKPV